MSWAVTCSHQHQQQLTRQHSLIWECSTWMLGGPRTAQTLRTELLDCILIWHETQSPTRSWFSPAQGCPIHAARSGVSPTNSVIVS